MRIYVNNKEQQIIETNYFESEYARIGAMFISINAGAFRLLVPPIHESMIADFALQRGHNFPWAIA
jgi:hypothetical protein